MIPWFLRRNHSVVGGLTVLLLAVCTSRSQVVLDGKFGTSGGLAGPNYDITAGVGATRGNNLFHSFAQFDLKAGDIAAFSGPANIQNILSRVTGGSPSSINGTIRSDIAGANFFFINPNGVMFGPNAAVNVSGSFAASTANYLKLADGARFVAALGADDSGLSTAPVSAFGFLGANPGSIEAQQSTLRAANSKTIALVGGDIAVDHGSVQSPGGQINIVSVQSAGEVPMDPTTHSVAEFSAAFPQQGQIHLQNGAQLDASGNGGGRIVIRGGRLIVDNSKIQANTTGTLAGQGIDIAVVNDLDLVNGGQINSLSTSSRGAGGNINLSAQSLRLDGGGRVDQAQNPTTQISTASGSPSVGVGNGKGGDIVIQADNLELVNSAQISSATYSAGNAGRIEITASSVRLDARVTTIAEISANTWRTSGGGTAGDIVIRTDTLDLFNGASLLAATFGTGNAGRIDITAKSVNMFNSGVITPATFGRGNGGSIAVSADSVLLDASFIQGVTTFVAADPAEAKGGNIAITAGSIDIRNGGQVSATTLGSGSAGTIDLTADSIRLTGDNGVSGVPTGISAASGQKFGNVDLVGTGNGGDVVIKPKNPGALALVISDGAQISTSTLGSGSGGRIDITAGSIDIRNGGQVSATTVSSGSAGTIDLTADSMRLTGDNGASGVPTGIRATSGQKFGDVVAVGTGNGGDIVIKPRNPAALSLVISDGAQISTSTLGSGNGGRIDISASSLRLDGGGNISSESSSRNPGAGTAGNVTVNALDLVISDGAQISTSTLGPGNGGRIDISASSLRLDSRGNISSASTPLDPDDPDVSAGTAGNVTVKVSDSVIMTEEGFITTAAPKSDGGNISITAGSEIQLTDSKITAEAGPGGGGEVTLLAPTLIYLLGSELTAEAVGNGGNLMVGNGTIDPVFFIINNSDLISKSTTANGGNITILSDYFFQSESSIDASGALRAGTVIVSAPEVDLSGSLVGLPNGLLDAETRLRPDCGVRLSESISSFIVLGRGGLPIEPGGFMPSGAVLLLDEEP